MATVLVMLYGLITPPRIDVRVGYAVVVQIMIVFVGVAFVAMRMRYAVIVQEVIESVSVVMILIIVSICYAAD